MQLTPNQKSYQQSKPEIVFDVMEQIYMELRIHMRMLAEETTILDKDFTLKGFPYSRGIFYFAVSFFDILT